MAEKGRWFAEKLFRLMPDFDRFDIVLMHIGDILSSMTQEEAKRASLYYDFTELHNRLVYYARTCERLAKVIDTLFES